MSHYATKKEATNLSRDKINFVSKNYHLKYRF
jgi:hypothetical protein